MATGQTTAESCTEGHEDHEVTDTTAEKHDRALAVVQRLLKASEIRTQVVHRISLKLFGDGRPSPQGKLRRHAPELIAYGDAGWTVATVAMGRRSGYYLISLPAVGVTSQIVNADQPHAVVDLVLAAARVGGRVGE
ncbi:hypothetical protein ACQPYK_43270 [Streptosporangium sp. CA-135522]|uniref:hypothetical protein n=1 Tax=Streptosporangium sp. CA-135522 TaxID=3240072 RepID=UPI003D8B1BF4